MLKTLPYIAYGEISALNTAMTYVRTVHHIPMQILCRRANQHIEYFYTLIPQYSLRLGVNFVLENLQYSAIHTRQNITHTPHHAC